MLHTGSCHCGRIRFQVEGEIDSALACNCSICSRRASLLWFVPHDKLRLATPEDAAASGAMMKMKKLDIAQLQQAFDGH